MLGPIGALGRAFLTPLLTDTCTLRHYTPGSESGSGETPGTWTETTVACHVAPASTRAQEREVAGRIVQVAPWVVSLPAGTVVQLTDQVVHQGRTLEVVNVQGPQTWEIVRQVDVVVAS